MAMETVNLQVYKPEGSANSTEQDFGEWVVYRCADCGHEQKNKRWDPVPQCCGQPMFHPLLRSMSV
jgi:hypothetical protein